MLVAASMVVSADHFLEGTPGTVVPMQVAGGNGVDGGPGGDFLIFVSDPGAKGFVNTSGGISVAQAISPSLAFITLTDAANGGSSVSPNKPGGRGGFGWNGCLFASYTPGTDGGPGGTLKVGGAKTTARTFDVSGGDGGDGWTTAGRGGAAGALVGAMGGNGTGTKGTDGTTCPVVSVQPQSTAIQYDAPTGPCQPPQNPAGSVTIRGLLSTPVSFTAVIVNLQGASGIGLLPNQSTTGAGAPAVSGVAPPGGDYKIWYNFDRCTALNGGGNFSAEIRVTTQSGNQTFVVPITGTVR
jgi:hypothetical protein